MSTDDRKCMTDPREPIAEATHDEEQAIREAVAEFVVGQHAATSKGRLHLDDGDGTPMCDSVTTLRDGREWRTVATAVYPIGSRDMCRYCTHFWREGAIPDE